MKNVLLVTVLMVTVVLGITRTDSSYVSGGIKTTRLTATGQSTLDTVAASKGISAPVFRGPLIGNVTATTITATGQSTLDTVAASKGISAPVFRGPLIGAVTATTISSSSTSNLDSLNVTKGSTIGGNVGIGTTSPAAKLDVRSSSNSDVIAAFGAAKSVDSSYPGSIYISYLRQLNCGYNVNGITTFRLNYNGYQNGATQYRNLSICDGKGQSVMYVDGSAGAVGINTTTPAAKLDVNGHAITSTFKTGACTTTTIRASGYVNLQSFNTTIGYADSAAARAFGVDNGTIWRKIGDGGILRIMY